MRLLFFEFSLTLRRLLRRPGQAALLFGTFSVSIGLALVSWAVFHTVILRQPSFDPHGRLWAIRQSPVSDASVRVRASHDEYLAWRDAQTSFEVLGAAVLHRAVFLGAKEGAPTERVLGANLGSTLLSTLEARPVLGRLFLAEDDRPGCPPTVLLSDSLWARSFRRDPDVIGKTLWVDGRSATVIGVMPPDFQFPNQQDLWLALGFHPSFPSPTAPVLDLVGRLRPGRSAADAKDELARISMQRTAAVPNARAGLTPVVEPFRYVYIRSQLRLSAVVLLVLSLVFVGVSCVNSAHLVLIDFVARAVEHATSAAIGIPRAAAVRAVFLQLLVVTLAGAVLGVLALVWLAPEVYAAFRLWDAPYWLTFEAELHHFVIAAGLAVLAAVIAAAGPAYQLARNHPERLLTASSTRMVSRAQHLTSRLLMLLQVALLTVLTVFAGLLLRSSLRLNHLSWGFDPEPVFNVRTGMRPSEFPNVSERREVYERVLTALRQVPGVRATALAHQLPGYENRPGSFYGKSASDLDEGRSPGRAIHLIVSDEFFATLDIPFVQGGTLARRPGGAVDEAVITRSLAGRLWPGEEAIGRTLYLREGYNERSPRRALTVCGVVADIRTGGPLLREHDAVFTSIARETQLFYFLLVRGDAGKLPVESALQAAVAVTEPRLPLYFGAAFARQLEVGTRVVHLTTRLALILAVIAAALCGVGVYSLTVSQVLQRTRDFGIRLAVGVDPATLWRGFAAGNLATLATGALLGLVVAAIASPSVTALLTEVTPWDPWAFIGGTGLIAGVSAIACIPSWRRLQRLDPAECLRTF